VETPLKEFELLCFGLPAALQLFTVSSYIPRDMDEYRRRQQERFERERAAVDGTATSANPHSPQLPVRPISIFYPS
jgi:hypothetical protein